MSVGDALKIAATAPFAPDQPLAVAVSGGGDSMALLHLLAHSPLAAHLHAVTVDHGLRNAAKAEAQLVATLCANLNIPHSVLNWERPDTAGNLMDQARRARYDLMADWAKANGIAKIALAHTADDVAETFLMRLSRQAGIDGLSAMRPMLSWNGTQLYRPLLAHTRADLRAYLAETDTPFADDPTNHDPTYDRTRARQALAQLAPLGITADTLAATAQNLAQARDALAQTARYAADCIEQDGPDLIFHMALFETLHPEIQRRLVNLAQRWITGAHYPERESKQATFRLALLRGRPATLGGCLLLNHGATRRLTREHQAVKDAKVATTDVWDGRWRLSGPHDGALHIAPLGPRGLPKCPDWRAQNTPRPSLLASPAIWQGGTLIAAPCAGFNADWQAHLAKSRDDFAGFILSH